MTLRRPKMKGLTSLALALVLLGVACFLWWQLAYVYNLQGGTAAMVWKRGRFGPLMVDARSPGGLLVYNLGRIPKSRVLCTMPFNDSDLYLLLYVLVAASGLVQLYLASYFLRKRAP